MREALAARGGELLPGRLELLDRKGRSVGEWRRALADVPRAGSSYRSFGLPAEDLEAIVQSPEVSAERRIGAALALSSASAPATAERLRVAAAQCASPRVRVVPERAGEGTVDEEAVAEALAEVEATPAIR